MNRPRTAAWCTTLAMAAALGSLARGGEVTVVGAQWHSRPDATLDPPHLSPEVQPASPPVTLPPTAEEKTAGASSEPTGSSEAPALCPSPLFTLAQRPLEASWYTRFDYFVFKEESHGSDLFDEHGTLYTLGYVRSRGATRLRVEAFTGTMNYTPGYTWSGIPFESVTRYFGARGEFELIWDVQRDGCSAVSAFVGIGSRFWIRDLKDGALPANNFWMGNQENWWTLYPYVGLEKRWDFCGCEQIFLSGRVGPTAWTYEYASTSGAPSLSPSAGVTGQVELGLRYEQFYITAYFEAMTWGQSPVVQGYSVPTAQTYATGLKFGLSF